MSETNKQKNTRGRNIKRQVLFWHNSDKNYTEKTTVHTSDPDKYAPNHQQILVNWI